MALFACRANPSVGLDAAEELHPTISASPGKKSHRRIERIRGSRHGPTGALRSPDYGAILCACGGQHHRLGAR